MEFLLRDEDDGQLIGGWITSEQAVIRARGRAISIQDFDLMKCLGPIYAFLEK